MTPLPPRPTKRELALFLHASPKRSTALLHELPQLTPPGADYRTQLTALHHLDAASRNAPIPDSAAVIRTSGEVAPPLREPRVLNLLALREQFPAGDLPNFATLAAQVLSRHDLGGALLNPGVLAQLLLEARSEVASSPLRDSDSPAPETSGGNDSPPLEVSIGSDRTPDDTPADDDRIPGNAAHSSAEMRQAPPAHDSPAAPVPPLSFPDFVRQLQTQVPDLLDLLAASHPGDAEASPEVIISRALFRQALLNLPDFARRETRKVTTLAQMYGALLIGRDDPLSSVSAPAARQMLSVARTLDTLSELGRGDGFTPQERTRFLSLRAALLGSTTPIRLFPSPNIGAVRVGVKELQRQMEARRAHEHQADEVDAFIPGQEDTVVPALLITPDEADQATVLPIVSKETEGLTERKRPDSHPVESQSPMFPALPQPGHAECVPLSEVVGGVAHLSAHEEQTPVPTLNKQGFPIPLPPNTADDVPTTGTAVTENTPSSVEVVESVLGSEPERAAVGGDDHPAAGSERAPDFGELHPAFTLDISAHPTPLLYFTPPHLVEMATAPADDARTQAHPQVMLEETVALFTPAAALETSREEQAVSTSGEVREVTDRLEPLAVSGVLEERVAQSLPAGSPSAEPEESAALQIPETVQQRETTPKAPLPEWLHSYLNSYQGTKQPATEQLAAEQLVTEAELPTADPSPDALVPADELPLPVLLPPVTETAEVMMPAPGLEGVQVPPVPSTEHSSPERAGAEVDVREIGQTGQTGTLHEPSGARVMLPAGPLTPAAAEVAGEESAREVHPAANIQGEAPEFGSSPLACPAEMEVAAQVQGSGPVGEQVGIEDRPQEGVAVQTGEPETGTPDELPGAGVPLPAAAEVMADVSPEVQPPSDGSPSPAQLAPSSEQVSPEHQPEAGTPDRAGQDEPVTEKDMGELSGAGGFSLTAPLIPGVGDVTGDGEAREVQSDTGTPDEPATAGDFWASLITSVPVAPAPAPLSLTALERELALDLEARAVLAERLLLSTRLLERVRVQERWTVQYSTAEHLADCLVSAQELLAEHEALMEWQGQRLEPLMTPEEVQAFTRVDVRAWELVQSIRAMQTQG